MTFFYIILQLLFNAFFLILIIGGWELAKVIRNEDGNLSFNDLLKIAIYTTLLIFVIPVMSGGVTTLWNMWNP